MKLVLLQIRGKKKALNSRYYVGKIRVEGANKRRFTSEQSTKNSSDSQRHTSFPRVCFSSVNEFKAIGWK